MAELNLSYGPVTVAIPQGQNFVVVSGLDIPFVPTDAVGAPNGGDDNEVMFATVDLSTLSQAGATFNLSAPPADASMSLVVTFYGSGPTPPTPPPPTPGTIVIYGPAEDAPEVGPRPGARYDPYAVHARGLGAFQAKMGLHCPTFLWNQGNPIEFDGSDSVWKISPSTVTTKDHLGTGGFQQDFTLRFSALTAQFYSAPQVTSLEQLRRQMINTPMGYLGAAYKITTVEIGPNGRVLTIEANALDQNA